MPEVPITYFLDFIEKLISWDDFLETKDLGNLKRVMNVKKIEPLSSTPAPAVSPLYRFVSNKERSSIRLAVDNTLHKKET